MGMLLFLLLPLPGVGELCDAPEDEWDEDTVDEEERDVAQLPWPLVLLRGGVGGGTGPASVEQSFELRLGDKREGKLNVLVHCAKLRTIVCLYVCRLKLIPKCFKLLFIFCCWFVFAHFVYCVFSFSLPVLCTHHKFGFLYFEYFTILHKYFKTSHSARTTHARLAWICFYYFADKERAQSARKMNRLRRLLESNWIEAVAVQETNPNTAAQSAPAGRSQSAARRLRRDTLHTCASERERQLGLGSVAV